MRLSGAFLRSTSLLALLSGSITLAASAQSFAAAAGTSPALTGDIPLSVPSALPPHHKKTDAPLIYARVRDGIYSVDGMVGKVQLNYDVKAANYLYLFVPGVGTALVSLAPSHDSISVPAAYHDSELTFRVAGHTLNLTGVESLVNDKGKTPTALYVQLDRESWKLNRTPMIGFGNTAMAPYQWPGALPEQLSAQPDEAAAPAPPKSLLPRTVAYRVPAAALQ